MCPLKRNQTVSKAKDGQTLGGFKRSHRNRIDSEITILEDANQIPCSRSELIRSDVMNERSTIWVNLRAVKIPS